LKFQSSVSKNQFSRSQSRAPLHAKSPFILATDATLPVCAEVVDGRDAVQKAREERPDIVVKDISMPNRNGLDAAREIKGILPVTEIIIVSQHDSAEMVRQAFKAGARGYVMKSDSELNRLGNGAVSINWTIRSKLNLMSFQLLAPTAGQFLSSRQEHLPV